MPNRNSRITTGAERDTDHVAIDTLDRNENRTRDLCITVMVVLADDPPTFLRCFRKASSPGSTAPNRVQVAQV